MSEHKLRISVKGIFKNEKNEVLLVRLGKNNQTFWSAPGGGVGEDEPMLETLRREFLEETGFEVEIGEIIFVQDIKFSNGSRQLELFFEGETGKQVRENPDEEYGFFSQEEFQQIEFMPKDLDPFSEHKKIPFFSEI
jgi:ADP-ribose pyrophosphatase YjhB (NUDIX family)